jgi:hypothetical protein
MPVDASDRLADDLGRAGYRGLFLAGEQSSAPSFWCDGANREALLAIVADERYGDLERVLASEILYAHDPGYPPRGWDDLLGSVYARALAITGTGERPIVLTGNEWGFLYHGGGEGALGAHLLDAGSAAVGHLVSLLDDPAPVFYEGSQEATLGNALDYRVKDAAAYYIGVLAGISVPFHAPFDQRDAEIERVKAQVTR